jgi:cation diffusion facilitator CzcD-associated flavoprotein CzcO
MPEKPTLAVIGLGASALVMMKILAEEGFDVSVFERSSSIGGVWGYEDMTTKTTVLKSMSQILFCPGLVFEAQRITRDAEKHCWDLRVRRARCDTENIVTRQFDRVGIASGINHLSIVPEITVIEMFGGKGVHS